MSRLDTDSLVAHLAQAARVAPLAPPAVRLAGWLAVSLPYVAIVVWAMSPRADLDIKLAEPWFLIEQLAALGTGLTAGLAAFASVVPGFDRRWLLLPLVPLAVWLGTLTLGCLRSVIEFGPHGLALHADWACFPAIVMIGLVPAIALAVMLRRGAPLHPHLTTGLGGLAAAGLGDAGLRLFHAQDASVMVLVWQIGSVFILTALAAWAGRLLLDWRSLTTRVRRRLISGYSEHPPPSQGSTQRLP